MAAPVTRSPRCGSHGGHITRDRVDVSDTQIPQIVRCCAEDLLPVSSSVANLVSPVLWNSAAISNVSRANDHSAGCHSLARHPTPGLHFVWCVRATVDRPIGTRAAPHPR